jgi:phospholipid/cholesterol/gamma-HCH transport system substrate-binding protein
MKLFDKKTHGDLVRLVIFCVITTLATGLLVLTIGNLSFGGTKEYSAEFTDATGVTKGDDVRIAGVKVGTVQEVEVSQASRALVTFTLDADTALSTSTRAAIRYRNLVGQRYVALTSELGDGGTLEEGDTIPVGQTTPALDLTVLFNGFKPLFEALSPDDINKLSYEIIQVFQGEGGTLDGLLAHTASVTQTLADRDAVIDSLIDNLNYVLDHVADRDTQLSRLIVTFRQFVAGLAADREALLGPLEDISTLSVETADLVKGIRSPFVEDIKQLNRVAGNIDAEKAELDRTLQVLPLKLNKIGNTATYGAWFNFYLCHFAGSVRLTDTRTVPVNYNVGGERCDLG